VLALGDHSESPRTNDFLADLVDVIDVSLVLHDHAGLADEEASLFIWLGRQHHYNK
jgi:hypothetical protein